MRKKYSKPEIAFESFTMSTSIAAGCEMKTSLPSSEESCGYPIRGGVVFVEGAACDTYPQSPDGSYDGFCYHVPADTNNLFNS